MQSYISPSYRSSSIQSIRNRRPLFKRLLSFALMGIVCLAVSRSGLATDIGNFNTADGAAALDSPNLTGHDNTGIGYAALTDNTNGLRNTATGAYSLLKNQSGDNNTAVGWAALYSNTSGGSNTGVGYQALDHNTAGFNTAVGYNALFSNTSGSLNTALGTAAMPNNTTGFNNTTAGANAFFFNQTGSNNVAIGEEALFHNLSANFNTAIGVTALHENNGELNTATGGRALYTNSSGSGNVANGYAALRYNTDGSNQMAAGAFALNNNTTGNNNAAAGYGALYRNTSGTNNTALGNSALANNITGSGNLALGYQAGLNLTTGSNNIDIGNTGVAGESGKIRIGTKGTHNGTLIAGISGKTVAAGVGVIINSNGLLGTVQSSARFKTDIKPMDKVSEVLLALKPVTFRYKEDLDPDRIPQFGLIAEEVEKVAPNLVVRDEDGKVSTVRYEAVNAMLLNEFLKEHRKVVSLEGALADERKKSEGRAAHQQMQIEALTAAVQKVSNKVELAQSAHARVAGK